MSRFAEHLYPKTMLGIESVVEYVERTAKPFTVAEAYYGARVATYSTVQKTLWDLHDHGLVKQFDPPGTKPMHWQRIDTEAAR